MKRRTVKLRPLTDEQFKSAPQPVKQLHIRARLGTLDMYSDNTHAVIKKFPKFFLKEPFWPNNPVSVIYKATKYLFSEIWTELKWLFRK